MNTKLYGIYGLIGIVLGLLVVGFGVFTSDAEARGGSSGGRGGGGHSSGHSSSHSTGMAAGSHSTAMRASPTVHTSNNLPLYVMLAVHSNHSQASSSVVTEAGTVEVATALLTVCTTEELKKAQLWQGDCKQLSDINYHMCPLLSYFRYCKEAAPDDVKSLSPVKPLYHNVYLQP